MSKDTATASSMLRDASKLVDGDRREAYGDARDNFAYIARLWSAYLFTDIRARDVANCMCLLKMARQEGPWKEDTFVDGAAYMALAGEVSKPEFD